MCDTKEHDTISCTVILGIKEALHGQVNAIGHYSRGGENPYSNTYNPGWRDHPNFGWHNKRTSNPQAYQRGFHNLNSIKRLLFHHNHNITNLHQLHHSHIHQSHRNLMPYKGGNLAQVHTNCPTKGTLRTHFRLSCKANKLSIKTLKPKLVS